MSKNGIEGRVEKQLADIRELLQMTAAQTAQNAKERLADSRQFRLEMKQMRDEHNREMREIRVLFKRMVKRIAV
jgi:hypothetical protein